MRYLSVVLFLSATASASGANLPNIETAVPWEGQGRSLFEVCEFKQAARAFEKAAIQHPDSAVARYWLGKSYARLAEISGPLSATAHARKARYSLELAATMDPRNAEYLRELFEFYLESPEWFRGGLSAAANVLERLGSVDPASEPWLRRQLADARNEYSGGGWRIRQAILWTSGAIGYAVPQPLR